MEGLIGAVVGGVFALIGGWFAIQWQLAQDTRGLAGALLAELSVAKDLLEKRGGAAIYQQMIDNLKESGVVANRDTIIHMFDNAPQDVLPVYYSSVGKLGLFPRSLASELVEYHAKIVALPRVAVRFLGKQQLDQSTVRNLAASIERELAEAMLLRDKIIGELSTLADEPTNPFRLSFRPSKRLPPPRTARPEPLKGPRDNEH